MEKNKKTIAIITVILSLSLASILVTIGFVIKNKQENPESWILHSYGNNVALYNGEKIIEVYGGIMLNTLPEEDKRLLDSGIAFPTREEAVNAVEDYDG